MVFRFFGNAAYYFFITVFILVSVSSPVFSELRAPKNFGKVPQSRNEKEGSAYNNNFGLGLIQAYRSYISTLDGPWSPSYPTGSSYGFQAMETYGILRGTVITIGRLLQEGEYYEGPYILKFGVKRYFDPLEHNVYWWDEDIPQNTTRE